MSADRRLKVALIPLDIAPGDKIGNVNRIGEIISGLHGDTDLVVLPEMCTTGFINEPESMMQLAEGNDGFTIDAMRGLAARYGVAIWGGYVALDASGLHNRGFMVSSDGEDVHFYDKRHLFAGGERAMFTAGDRESPIVEVGSWRLKMMICYDLRFPVWCRNHVGGYDAMIVPANWPDSRFYAWSHLLIARAMENQAYVVGCNRSGHDLYGDYCDRDSLVINQRGEVMDVIRENGVIYAILDDESLKSDRRRFKYLEAADRFEIIP